MSLYLSLTWISILFIISISSISEFPLIYQALLNSNAAVNLIHKETIWCLGLEITITLKLLQILIVNGKTLSITICQVTLQYIITNVSHEDTFVIVRINIHSLMLSMLFLKYTNALVKWKEQTVHFSLQSIITFEPFEASIYNSQVATHRPTYPFKKWKSSHFK